MAVRRKIRQGNAFAWDRWNSQEAFLKAWLTLRAIGSALFPAIFCPSAVSSLVRSLSISNCLRACVVHSSTISDGAFAAASWRANWKTALALA